MQRRDGGREVGNVLQGLRHDKTVEGSGWQAERLREIPDDSCIMIVSVDVDDIAARSAGAEPPCIGGILDLQHPSADVVRVPLEKVLNIWTVDRRAATPAAIADRFRTSNHPESDWQEGSTDPLLSRQRYLAANV